MNWIDILRLFFVYAYIFSPKFSDAWGVSFIVYFLIWIKFPKYLQVFDGARQLLYTIYKTMSSIKTFMLFLSIALLIYAHLTYVLCLDTPNAVCGDSLFGNFVLSFGLLFSIMDGYTDFPGKQLFLLFTFSLVIPIVLANLLIAIMSNTYNRLSNS